MPPTCPPIIKGATDIKGAYDGKGSSSGSGKDIGSGGMYLKGGKGKGRYLHTGNYPDECPEPEENRDSMGGSYKEKKPSMPGKGMAKSSSPPKGSSSKGGSSKGGSSKGGSSKGGSSKGGSSKGGSSKGGPKGKKMPSDDSESHGISDIKGMGGSGPKGSMDKLTKPPSPPKGTYSNDDKGADIKGMR